jgi:hypothetical protein
MGSNSSTSVSQRKGCYSKRDSFSLSGLFEALFEIYTDPSSTQLGAVVTQDNRPIALFSRKLSKIQQKYSVTEIELLAIVKTLKEFKGMLWGQDIKVYTDHKISQEMP